MNLSEADEVLNEIENMARRKFLPIIGPERGRTLVEVTRKIKPKHVLEVGTLIGYSTILMGKEMNKDAKIITIEIDPDEAEIARKNIKRANIPPKTEVLVGNAIDVIPKLDKKFDLVFIDAEKSEYLSYLQLLEDKLHKGSVIVADNAELAPHYLNYVRKTGKYLSKHIPASWGGLEISIKL